MRYCVAWHRLKFALFFVAACALTSPYCAFAQTTDGRHDFDFGLGTWRTQIKRLEHPLAHSSTWLTYTGSVTARKVWGGDGSVEEIEADGPAQSPHMELMSVRLYNAQSKQWSIYGVNSSDPMLGPAMYGEFANGRGTFYDQEPFNGRMVLVRQVFSGIGTNAYSFEQAFSDDGGLTWEPNFVAHLTRLSRTAPSEGSASVANTSHDFDFNYGTWTTHIRSLRESKNGSKTWDRMVGTVALRKIWNGRGFLEEIKAGNATGGFAGLTLYLYNPQSHQWSQTFAAKDSGAFDPSMVGGFKNGRGELISQGTYNGRAVLLHETWSKITPKTHHFEIGYSEDGGATWQPTFIADLTRSGPGR